MVKVPFRKNSSFTNTQHTFIILKYGELKNTTLVRRAFRAKFFPNYPTKVPQLVVFQRVIDRFLKNDSEKETTPRGQAPISDDDVKSVRDFFKRNPKASIRMARDQLDLSFGSVWKILRKILKFRPYKPQLAQVLSPANKSARLAASEFFLSFSEEQFEKFLWSDEKWFVLNQAPNRKNDVVWGPEGTRNVVSCKKAHGAKVMAWVGIVDGQVLPVHWFQGSVDSSTYLSMLKDKVWPAIRSKATRRNYWFMQDGAAPHCTQEVLSFLASKFGERVVSRKTAHAWPPYSPDLNPLDFSFWSQAMAHVVRCQPITLEDLKAVVNDFATNFDPEKARSMARHARYRWELCRRQKGGHFEDLLRKRSSREE